MKKRRIDILSKATDEGSIGYRESITGNRSTPVSVWSRRNLLLLPCGSYPLKDMTLIARPWRTRWCTARVDDLCDARPFEEWRENHKEKKREREERFAAGGTLTPWNVSFFVIVFEDDDDDIHFVDVHSGRLEFFDDFSKFFTPRDCWRCPVSGQKVKRRLMLTRIERRHSQIDREFVTIAINDYLRASINRQEILLVHFLAQVNYNTSL